MGIIPGALPLRFKPYNFYTSYVGNILGENGQQLLTEPSGCDAGPQSAFLQQVLTTSDWNAANDANDVPMWQMGAYQATVNSTGNWSFVDTTIEKVSKAATARNLQRHSAAGFLAMSGQIIDASIVAAPKQRNTDGEKRDVFFTPSALAKATATAKMAPADHQADSPP
jgi:hypothetical protein